MFGYACFLWCGVSPPPAVCRTPPSDVALRCRLPPHPHPVGPTAGVGAEHAPGGCAFPPLSMGLLWQSSWTAAASDGVVIRNRSIESWSLCVRWFRSSACPDNAVRVIPPRHCHPHAHRSRHPTVALEDRIFPPFKLTDRFWTQAAPLGGTQHQKKVTGAEDGGSIFEIFPGKKNRKLE